MKKLIMNLYDGYKGDKDEIGKLYSTLAAILFYPNNYVEIFKKDKHLSPSGFSYNFEDIIVDEIMYNGCNISQIELNDILHMIHIENPEAREYAIDALAQFNDSTDEYTFESINTLQGVFPEELCEKVHASLDCISDDVSFILTTTWMYCHHDCGINYRYQENEHPVVKLNSLSQEGLELALWRLEQIEKSLDK